MASLLSGLISQAAGTQSLAFRNTVQDAVQAGAALDRSKFAGAAQQTGFNPSFQPTSVLAAFQRPSAEATQQALGVQLGGINQAARQARRGFQASRRDITRGTQDALGRLSGGLQGGLGSLQEGLEGAREALRPLRETTIGALGRFADLTGISGRQVDISQDPAFQFRFEQGQRAVRAAQAAGGVGGGRAAKELTEFGQGLAAEEITSQSNRLLNLIGIGAGGFAQQAQIEAATAGQAAGLQAQEASQAASLLANQGLNLAQLRTGLSQSLADASLARAQAQSQATLQQGSILQLLQQRGSRISPRNIRL